ncbi:FAD-dependent monooxygenase [Mesobacillus subterraneus]|uniref:FAD-binding domain-containing protein n=1 Tax=Mesobacillus subterraneus TaxID=285983 RepID=A0A427TSZ6_9BACI|nr:FAD-dependent monooxygenase [Mesobacillus subterraneus]RSD27538.1 hypothetical protein EJA10_09220 [Mesobacillus subterraneus]
MVQAEFAIIGGGISGLSTALALQRKGFRAEVYEQASGMNAPDTGIVLCGNAVRAFYILGLGPKLLEYGLASDICQLKSHSGELIAEFNYDAPTHIPNYLFIQRSVLHTLLADALLPGSLHFNKLLIDLKQDQHKIHVSFQDGSQAVSDFVIGCDGADSRIRSQYMPDGKLHYTGYVCWRGIVEAPSIEPIMYSETWGPRGRFGIAPMPGNRLYWYVFKKS